MFRRLLLCLLTLSILLTACAPAPTAAPTQVPPTAAPTAVPPTAVPPTATAVPPTATSAPDAAITLKDALGREVKLAAPAQRVVSLAPSNTEIVFAVGAGAQLVGREEFSDYPPEALKVTSVGSLYPRVNAEAIVALKPDLVLAAGITNPDDVKALSDLGLAVYATSFAGSLEDVFGDILAVGQLTGHADKAGALVDGLKTRVQAVQTKVAGAAQPRVFYEIDATDPGKPWTAGAGSFIDQLIKLAGGQNVGAVMPDAYAQMGLETLVAQDPELVILGSATYGGQTPELVAKRPGWETVSAVKNARVFTFDDNLVSRPGPRVVDGLEALAKLIHPELFK